MADTPRQLDQTVHMPRALAPLRPAPLQDGVHFLVSLDGDRAGPHFEVGIEGLTIGRDPQCVIVVPDSGVSRQHCRVVLGTSGPQVMDLGSTNGTFVNGERVSGSAALPQNAILQVGPRLFRSEHRRRRDVEASQDLDRDLENASRYIKSLLPPPTREGPLWIDWLYMPTRQIGGDALGCHRLSDHEFALYLVDAAGHGAQAAMHGVSVINVLRNQALPRTDFRKPAQVLKNLNAMFQMDTHGGMVFTIWYGLYDTTDRTIHYACAGHHPAFLVPPDRQQTIPLQTRNLVIGAAADTTFKAQTASVPPGSTFYLFSDGVFEIATPDGGQWTLRDFEPLLRQPPVPGLTETQRLYQATRAVAGTTALDDDFTIFVATFV
jgi:hypothetical protein